VHSSTFHKLPIDLPPLDLYCCQFVIQTGHFVQI
jgi:hypothetical protein